ncbi:MAG: entericidin A/B family lipoprotein [Thiolinea sp.]
MYKLIATFTALFCALLLTACSTVEGVGKDIKQVGSAIEQEAREEKAQSGTY